MFPGGRHVPPNYSDGRGKDCCGLHGEALVEADGYWTGRPVPMITPTDRYLRRSHHFPNALLLSESLEKSDFTPERRRVHFCWKCEEIARR